VAPRRDEVALEPSVARTISARDIRNAYVFQSDRARKRIEKFGKMNRAFLRSLTVRYFDSPEKRPEK
jgi:hypothetical protein